MASIQHNGFSQSQNYHALIFKALAHPARIAILEKLVSKERVMCKEFFLDFPLSQSTISNHLKVLLETGVVGYEKVSNQTYYMINPLMLETAGESLITIIQRTYDSNHNYTSTFFKRLPHEDFPVGQQSFRT